VAEKAGKGRRGSCHPSKKNSFVTSTARRMPNSNEMEQCFLLEHEFLAAT